MPYALRPLLFVLILSGASVQISGQGSYPTDYFRAPVDIPLLLSGTFGELRSNHFHSGIDIKTNGNSGEKIYAIADGYISRINVSTYGFGKALYINHPNGYTSVYAHLDYFTGSIHRYVISEHYRRESFEMTLYPEPGVLPVRKGDIIAYSGNSGSSSGPHLHFEIRDEATQVPINPLLFGIKVGDYHRPRINRIKIYAADSNSRVNGSKKDAIFAVEGWGEEHRLGEQKIITVSGSIGFGVQCYDQQNDSPNKNGIYSMKVFFDGKEMSETRMESFPFSDTRYINSLIDYPEYAASGMRFQRTEIDPGNRLKIYGTEGSHGLVFINDTLYHEVRMELADLAGNMSILEFKVKGQNILEENNYPYQQDDPGIFYYDRANHFEAEGFMLESPLDAFYRNFLYTYSVSPACEDCLSPIHHVHTKYHPIHNPVEIAIKPAGISDELTSKALIIKVEDKKDEYFSAGGSYQEDDGFVHTRIREFGNYSVALDTVPPSITALNTSSHKSLKIGDILKFRVRDELAGISEYRGTVNNEWILMEYDAKSDLLFYYVDDHLIKGPNNFRLEVSDAKDNTRIYETRLFLE